MMRSLLKFSLLALLIPISSCSVDPHTSSPDNRIIVLGEARMELPADRAVFHVELSASHPSDANAVYQQHKTQEAKLVQLLKDLNIPAKNISFSLLSVDKSEDYETRKWSIASSQRISFHIDSLKQYTLIQTRLIQEGFSNINSELTSSQQDKIEKPLLEQAVKAATEKATILAAAAGRQIKRVVKVADIGEEDPVFDYHAYRLPRTELKISTASGKSNNAELIDFFQTLPAVVRVKVVFELK
jgi:uncharacterized protein YggE